MGVTSNLDLEIGRRLRQARIAGNRTQDDLARELGISFQQVQKYENGANRISSSRLWQIAEIIGKPVTYFFDGLGETDISPGANFDHENTIADTDLRLARDIESIKNEKIKRNFKNLVRSILKEQQQS